MILRSVLLMIFSTMHMQAQTPTVSYKLGMSKPWTHLFEVEVVFDHLPSGDPSLELILPAWRTGRYLVFDFAGGVVEFSATDGEGKLLSWSKVDKSRWKIETMGSRKVIARYTVFANEFQLRTRGLNDEHGFVDGTSVFMYAQAYRSLPITLTVVPFGTWHVTTGLDAVKDKRFRFTAPNYDHLVDCPLEIGNQREYAFEVEGKPHVLSLFGKANWEIETVLRDISTIIKTNKNFWGDLPYERFVFLLHSTLSGRGATEHFNSIVLGITPFGFKDAERYKRLLAHLSHEIFHTWNVKRLRPRGMDPYDFTAENYYRELWIAEGATEYYEDILLVRSGLKTTAEYLKAISMVVKTDRQRPGNRVQSLTECSFDAWVKFWRRTQQSYNFETDYYDKGKYVSLILDFEIRNRTGNTHCMDDLMRTMYHRYPLGSGGYTVDDFQNAGEELAGGSLEQFFNDFVHGTVPLPWERFLNYAGLDLTVVDTIQKPWLGIVSSDAGEKTTITRVVAGSCGYDAGLNIGDEVLALDGFRVRTSDLQKRIEEMNAGDKVKLTVFRDDGLREFEVTLRHEEIPSYKITRVENPSPLQKSIYESWLDTQWEDAKE